MVTQANPSVVFNIMAAFQYAATAAGVKMAGATGDAVAAVVEAAAVAAAAEAAVAAPVVDLLQHRSRERTTGSVGRLLRPTHPAPAADC